MRLPRESWDVFGHVGPFDTRHAALDFIEESRGNETDMMLAVIDKHAEAMGQDGFAGVYGFAEYDPEAMVSASQSHFTHSTAPLSSPGVSSNSQTDTSQMVLFGLINILPRYHRTHINSHAMYLALSFLFDESHLVRVQYEAATFNETSIRAAMRFGFKAEGICRNLHGLVPVSKRRDGERDRQSQDLWMSGMTDYEWDVDGREWLRRMVEKPPVRRN